MGGPSSASFFSRRLSYFTLLVPCTFLLLPLLLYFQCNTTTLDRTSGFSFQGDQLTFQVRSALSDRGVALLHSWTDEELFRLAVQTGFNFSSAPRAESFLGRATNLIRWSRRAGGSSLPRPTRKVAFLFLTTGELPFEPLWNRFFRGHERLYNVYVHMDPFDFQVFSRNRSSVFWGRAVPSRKTERGSPLLVAAMKRLLANALLDDPENEYFAMLSDSCIPLHGFRRVYKRLTSSKRSFVEVIKQSELLWSRYNARGENVMLPEVPYARFTVGSQWFVLRREHAKLVVGEERMWSKFRLPCLEQVSSSSCYTEEHYFSTVMNSEEPDGSHGYTLTYVNWPENTDGHPTTYHAEDVSREFIQRLQREKDGRYLFARKFDRDCSDTLLRHGEIILKH